MWQEFCEECDDREVEEAWETHRSHSHVLDAQRFKQEGGVLRLFDSVRSIKQVLALGSSDLEDVGRSRRPLHIDAYHVLNFGQITHAKGTG